MPTTSNYGFPYPDLTDPPDGARQIGALAQAVDEELADAQTANRQARELLIPFADNIALPSMSNPSRSTYHDWGSAITFPNPGGSALVMAWGTGRAINDGNGSQHRLRLGISTNGGSSYNWGTDSIDQAGQGGSTRRAGLSAIHMVSNTEPSGSVMVRAQVYWDDAASGGSNMSFGNGRLMALVIPQG